MLAVAAENDELVAADTVKPVVREETPRCACHHAQHTVACLMTQVVVDFVQTNDVDVNAFDGIRVFLVQQRNILLKLRAVEQSRQCVAVAVVFQFTLIAAVGFHVHHVVRPADAQQRPRLLLRVAAAGQDRQLHPIEALARQAEAEVHVPLPAEYLRLQVCQRHKPLVVVQILRVNQPLTHQIVAEARKRHLRIRQRRRTLERLAFARVEIQPSKQQIRTVQRRNHIALNLRRCVPLLAGRSRYRRYAGETLNISVILRHNDAQQALGIFHRERAIEIVALPVDAVHRFEHIDLFLRLHALGDNRHIQLVRHIDNGIHNLDTLLPVLHVHLDELHVQLQHIYVRIFEHIER